LGGFWNDHGRTSGNFTWLKFDVARYPDERIVKVTINIGGLRQLNHPWDAGVRVHYVQDDSWTASTVQGDWPTTTTAANNRSPYDKGGTTSGRVSTDITRWLALEGEGQGETLSVRLSHSGGGLRGWLLKEPTTLTITTERPMRFGPPKGPVEGVGGLAVRSSLTTVFAEEAPEPDLDPVISLSAAKRESESAQIVVIAGQAPISVARVTVGDLANDDTGATIAARNVEAELVGYVTVRKNSWRGWQRTGLWPDVLMPMRPFEVPAGYCRIVWITVRVPGDASSGGYRGRIQIEYADRKTAVVPLKLHVWDFALPKSPALRTSYWSAMGHAYPEGLTDPALARKLHDLFADYRTSTDTWAGIRYYREQDGRIAVDWEKTKRNIEYAIGTAGFNTINVSSGCWGTSPFGGKTPIYDRRTGNALSEEERKAAVGKVDLMELYLGEACDWLEQKGWLERAYLQIWDEPKRKTWGWGCRRAYPAVRQREPRLKLLCVAGIHPELQGLFDVWVPHLHFYDAAIYRQAREGLRMYGKKSFPAKLTASSTGGWGTGAFYKYRPIDAYDGCAYTKWVPAKEPTADSPQWLQFDFEQPQEIDGIRVVPYGLVRGDVGCVIEVSTNGKDFRAARVRRREGMEQAWSFDTGAFRAVRLVYTKLPVTFTPRDEQPVPEPEKWAAGVREVEFLRRDLPLGSTAPRPKDQRPCEVWEYNVGADWPSVCIDARPHEHRATGWLMWLHRVSGYLNYGGGQWKNAIIDMTATLADPPPLIWRARGNGGPNITWPSRDGPLASVRFARFRDGIDDYDYLALLAQRNADHPLIRELRRRGRSVAASGASLDASRGRLAKALEERL